MVPVCKSVKGESYTKDTVHCFLFRVKLALHFVGTCTVVSVNEALVEAKMCTFTLEPTNFIFTKCPIYTHDGEKGGQAFSRQNLCKLYIFVLILIRVCDV